MAISYITSDGTIRHTLTGDTFGVPSISQVTADAITSKPVGLIANIDGSLNKWSGTIWEKQLKDSDVSEPDLDQFIELNGRYTLATLKVYTAGTTMLFDVARQYGMNSDTLNVEHNVPRYYFLGISRTGARDGNQSVIYHSSLVSPEILTNPKPETLLPVYLDQATMVADQVNQTSGQHYYYTGSTSAWLWNGVSGGVIGDYTEKVEGVDWEEWGTKPEWLIITGDAYLEGLDNLNKMTGTFHRRYPDGGTTLFDVVVLNIEAFIGGNLDTEDSKNQAAKIVDVQFNDNKDLTLDNTLLNDSIYADLIPVIISEDFADPTWNDLGNGNYSLQTGNNISLGLRAPIIGTVDSNFLRIWEVNKFTIVFRMRIRSTNTNDSDRVFLGNDTDGTDGFRFYYGRVNQQLSLRVGNVLRTTPTESFIMNTHDEFLCGAVTYDGSDGSINFYVKSTPRSIPFTTYAVAANTDKNILTTDQILRFNRYTSASSILSVGDRDYTTMFMRILTPAQIESLMIENGPI